MALLCAAVLAAALVTGGRADAKDDREMSQGHGMHALAATPPEASENDPDAVDPQEMARGKAKAEEEYGQIPGMLPIVEAIPTDKPVHRNVVVALFRHFLPPRAAAQKIALDYLERHPEEKPPANVSELSNAELQARLKAFMTKLSIEDPDAARRMQALLPRLQAAHNEVMTTAGPIGAAIMTADKGSRYLMLDPKGHDDNWVASQPDSPAPLQYRARERLINGDKQGALEDARRAVELDPGDAKSLALMASAQYDLKNYSAALDAAKAALAIAPDDPTANAVVKLARDPAASVATPASSPADGALGGLPLPPLSEALTGTLTPAQQQSLSLARQAEHDLGLGDDAAAEAAAKRSVELSPGYAHGYGLLGFAQARRLEIEQALQASARGLKLNPGDRMSHNARMLALNKSGRYQEALVAGSAALEAGTGGPYAHYMNAVARNGLSDRAGALEELRQAGAQDPRYADLYKAALQLSGDGDMSLLFTDVGPRAAVRSGGRVLSRTYEVIGGAAAGGLLLGFGLLGLARKKRGETARPAEPAAGQRLLGGQFSIARRIGQGGMGTVFEGVDLKLQRRVAIKRMRDELRFDEGLRRRFVTEAKLVAALSHPNIVALYSIVDEGEELSLIFEYVQGRTLHDVISAQGRLTFPQALSVLRGVADALTAAHARGIIHRDLKPSNIMITAEGAPKVMDFGVARAAKDAVSRSSLNTPNNTGTIVGTPPYMAPEQEQGVVRLESDVYALAVCAYEALSGELPFGGSAGGMLMNKINKAYTPISNRVSGLPAGIDEVFDRAFEPDADKRYRTVNELRAALEALRVPA